MLESPLSYWTAVYSLDWMQNFRFALFVPLVQRNYGSHPIAFLDCECSVSVHVQSGHRRTWNCWFFSKYVWLLPRSNEWQAVSCNAKRASLCKNNEHSLKPIGCWCCNAFGNHHYDISIFVGPLFENIWFTFKYQSAVCTSFTQHTPHCMLMSCTVPPTLGNCIA